VRHANADVEAARPVQVGPHRGAKLPIDPSNLVELMLAQDARRNFYGMLRIAVIRLDILLRLYEKRPVRTSLPKV
jgi:hypothetical protein